MILYYYDTDTKKLEEIPIKKLVVGADYATATLATGQFKLIKISTLLYVTEE